MANDSASTRPDERAKLKVPCPGCPFARTTDTAYLNARAKSPTGVRRFIGQSVGPFNLPCHTVADVEGWVPQDTSRPQCAGAAMYRDLTGSAKKMPPTLTRLKGDEELVFGTHAEYLAKHEKLTIREAEQELDRCPPEAMMLIELAKPECRIWHEPRN